MNETIVKITRPGKRWRLILSCGHTILWDGPPLKVGDKINCPIDNLPKVVK